ncbi:hypothetical protein L1987_71232 [Smallanthus sonchifolius]|uniref:Uncharacterized protein n=1 Tax=Smallanthus sonchifolius TaxID=185202 RepID=A0ACB9ARV3_9ASTR|nr:hypothetical protein L1987_71232 [Smallanthus sonchifolius]
MLIQIICIFLMPGRTTLDSVNDDKGVLNFDEYVKIFPYTVSRKNDPNLRYEASCARLDKWMELFPSIISRAKTLQVVTSNVNETPNASMQLIYDELQMLSLPICCANKRLISFVIALETLMMEAGQSLISPWVTL